MRPLILHVSALNDDEYDLYTTSFRDIIDADDDQHTKTAHDDAYYDRTTVGVREARAWLRGRYTDLGTGDIDSILRLFSPTLGQADSLNGGQFFAALRLLMHVRNGANVDRNLVFIQAHPDSHPSRPQSPPARAAKPVVPPRPPPSRRATSHAVPSPTQSDPDTSDLPSPDAPLPPPRPVAAHKRTVSSSHSSLAPPPPSKNPFVWRSKTELSVPSLGGLGPPPAASASQPAKSPPLPPRKPATLQPPPRHLSVSSAPEFATVRKPPPPVPSISSSHFGTLTAKTTSLISPLIQTSLQASKVAQVSRKAEEQREKERIMHVVKSSASSSVLGSTDGARSSSPAKGISSSRSSPVRAGDGRGPTRPHLPERRSTSPIRPPSSASSARSAGRTITNAASPFSSSPPDTNPFRARVASKSRSPIRREVSPPPTHPDRKAPLSPIVDDPDSPASPNQARLGRSKSLHHPTTPTPTPPVPPRRRRPESVQLTPTSSADGSPALPTLSPRPGSASFGSSLSRHLSLSSARAGGGRASREPSREPPESPMAHLQKRFTDLGARAQPRLEAALYKAEAGIVRRGFVSHAHGRDGGRLMDDPDPSVGSVDDSDLDQDREEDLGAGAGARAGERNRGMVAAAAPNGTWPVNEGWRRL